MDPIIIRDAIMTTLTNKEHMGSSMHDEKIVKLFYKHLVTLEDWSIKELDDAIIGIPSSEIDGPSPSTISEEVRRRLDQIAYYISLIK